MMTCLNTEFGSIRQMEPSPLTARRTTLLHLLNTRRQMHLRRKRPVQKGLWC